MPWVDPVDAYAAPPRIRPPGATQTWDGEIEFGRWYELADVVVADTTIDLTDCEHVEITVCSFTDATIDVGADTQLEAFQSSFDRSDLSRARFRGLRGVTFRDCKLVGADFGGGELTDVSFERCVLRLVNLRNCRLERVRFLDCIIADADCHAMAATDVAFTGSTLAEVNLDAVRADRVDLRSTRALDLRNPGSLQGYLVSSAQVPELAYVLAFALGLGVERDESDQPDDEASVDG